METWESPINLYLKDMVKEYDKQVSGEVVAQLKCKYGIDIDIDRLMKIMQNARFEWNKGYQAGYNEGTNDTVKHGHWIIGDWHKSDGVYPNQAKKCSCCFKTCHITQVPWDTLYCPYCGAIMDEVET